MRILQGPGGKPVHFPGGNRGAGRWPPPTRKLYRVHDRRGHDYGAAEMVALEAEERRRAKRQGRARREVPEKVRLPRMRRPAML